MKNEPRYIGDMNREDFKKDLSVLYDILVIPKLLIVPSLLVIPSFLVVPDLLNTTKKSQPFRKKIGSRDLFTKLYLHLFSIASQRIYPR